MKKRYNLSLEEIDNYIQSQLPAIKDRIRHEAVASIVAVFLVNLHDEYGFGAKRLQRLLDKFNATYDCIDTDPSLNIQDFYKLCYDEFGIDIKRR